MPTHQELGGITDQEMVDRMVSSYADRFGETYWRFFSDNIGNNLPAAPRVVDIGCGPGLLLKDIENHYPGASLVGTDITQAMIDYAGQLDFGKLPALHVHDITQDPLPLEDNTVDLVIMVAVLHVIDQPGQVLTEIKRVLKPGAVFMLQDWIRKPLADYLERMTDSVEADKKERAKERFMSMFPAHNKYTIDDWEWVLTRHGFKVAKIAELESPHFRTFVCVPA